MQPNFFSHEDIVARYVEFSDELFSDTLMAMKRDRGGNHDGAMSRVEAELLYTVLRRIRPKHALEFSPNHGYSTAFVAEALKANDDGTVLHTFDLHAHEGLVPRMEHFNLGAVFHQGDALEQVPLYIVDNDLVGAIDFCLIDSDHTYDFARKYGSLVIPLLGPRCVMFIHDMCYRPQNFQQFAHYGELLPYEIGGTITSLGEAAYLQEWYLAHIDDYAIFSTHRLFGDNHEFSSVLPRNESLITALQNVSPHFSLPNSAGQEGGFPRCPMGLWVIPRVLLEEVQL